MLPPDWREQMVDMVRGAAPAEGGWFAGGPVLAPEEQIGVYREQYRLRLMDAVRDEVPGLVGLMGESADALLWTYLTDHPSTGWSLNQVADHLVPWLEHRGARAVQVDMARLDYAVMSGFVAADREPLDLDCLRRAQGAVTLVLDPAVGLLRLRYNLHAVRSAIVRGDVMPPVREQDVPLVVFRHRLKMRHRVLEPAAWSVLGYFRTPRSIGTVLEAAVADGMDPEVLAEGIGRWFELFGSLGLFCRA